MAIRQIYHLGEEALRRVSRPVDVLNKRMLTLLDDLAETMYEQEGAGLAAPQVGVLRRAIVIDIGDDNGLIQMINPEIVAREGEKESVEACLSVPGVRGYVSRPEKISVRGIARSGKEMTVEADGLLAIAFCHEIDHLDGVLFIDKMTRMATEEELSEAEKEK